MATSNFVDYVKIFARSGHGGAGSAHFRREKFVAFGGPDGGDGGKGGSIVLVGDRQYWTLIHLKYQRHQFAEDGQNGSGARSSGKDARDIVIPVPLGTVAKRVVENEAGEQSLETVGEVTEHGERLVLLKGGRGGLGNWHFKSATNQTPRYAQPGEEGDEGAFILELKVLADVGLVGFPNAGKSTLLSVVSAAKPKIADYAFTTLEPNLGIVEVRGGKSFVMADIPGIIEGAHEGKGLGTRFLRHIERNSVLLFMIPADSDDIRRDYEVLLGELTQYNPELLDKQRLLAVTKCDMLDEELIEELRAHVPDGLPTVFISSVSGLHIAELKDRLWEVLNSENPPRD
ncbi:MAG: GTPase ObgE [Alistipes senegalensis]|nr:GTPase ObgE [Bacteroides cellulosilyticus]MCM1351734.1 GTPase ObgE [Alistipes senegalensis]